MPDGGHYNADGGSRGQSPSKKVVKQRKRRPSQGRGAQARTSPKPPVLSGEPSKKLSERLRRLASPRSLEAASQPGHPNLAASSA